MKNHILEIKDLTCGYDSKIILRDISLKIAPGEFIGIVGPNGSGKTTLLRAISRVLKLKEGAVFFEGRNIRDTALKELAKRIAVVSQISEASPMSVEEFVLLGRTPHYRRFQFLETKIDLDIAGRAMEMTDILKIKKGPMNEISGGERQLASIARALTQEPELFLLDEPTAHLDIAHQVAVLDLIKKLNRDLGLTVIMVLHDLNLASEYCDRIALLDNGGLSEIGPPRKILNYELIEKIYKTVVVVKENPATGRPYVFLVPGSRKRP